MSQSIDQLAKNLNSDQFNIVNEQYSLPIKNQLIKQKGVFSYNYVNSFERLDEKELAKECFFNEMTNCEISDEQYNHAKLVWCTFDCNTLGEYTDVYLKSDVLILADIFENFRKTCHETYKLDPAHYYTLPGLSWDAMLKLTKIELELLTDIDMIHFFKREYEEVFVNVQNDILKQIINL